MPKKGRNTAFKEKWIIECGVEIETRCIDTAAPTTLVCSFCKVFGKDAPSNPENRKRKRSTRIQVYKQPWRPDKMKEHNKAMHSSRWENYKTLSLSEKQTYFLDCKTLPKNQISANPTEISRATEKRIFHIDKKLIDFLIRDSHFILSDPFDIASPNSNSVYAYGGISNVENGHESIKAIISNTFYYDQIINLVGNGFSFRQATSTLRSVANDGSISTSLVTKYMSIYCALALQLISRCLQSVWAFSISLGSIIVGGHHYYEVRVRFVLEYTMFNVHLITTPVNEGVKNDEIYNLATKLLDFLCPQWEFKVIGYLFDGDSKKLELNREFLRRLEQISHEGFYSGWCGSHQLDTILNEEINSLCGDSFFDVLQSMMDHLRRQKGLIERLKTICPRFSDKNWYSIDRILKWLTSNAREVHSYFTSTTPGSIHHEDHKWWLLVFVLDHLVSLCSKFILDLQSQPRIQMLEKLKTRIMELGNIQIPHSTQKFSSTDMVHIGLYNMNLMSAKCFVLNLGSMFIVDIYQKFEETDRIGFDKFNTGICNLFLRLVHRISTELESFVRNFNTKIPPCYPYAIAELSSFSFINILRSQLPRIHQKYNDSYIDNLESEFKIFREKYVADAEFKRLVQQTNSRSNDFQDSWNWLYQSYPKLVEFCGGLASVLPEIRKMKSEINVFALDHVEGFFYANQNKTLKLLTNVAEKLDI